MAIPRVALIAVAGAVLVVAAFLLSRPSEPSAPPSAAVPAAPAVSAPPPEPVADRPTDVAEPSESTDPADRVPGAVASALADGRVVVLMFAQSSGADDKATRARVERLEGDSRDLEVFTDNVSNLADYAAVVGGLGIDQAPATVIVSPDGDARVVQGFVDRRSLRQYAADASG